MAYWWNIIRLSNVFPGDDAFEEIVAVEERNDDGVLEWWNIGILEYWKNFYPNPVPKFFSVRSFQ